MATRQTVIPDIILLDVLNKGLIALRLDYNSVVTNGGNPATDSMLGIIFGNLALQRYVTFTQIVNLIITTPETPKHLIPKLSYDPGASTYPSVHLTMPAESDSHNVIGIGEGNQDEIFIDNSALEPFTPDEYRRQFVRKFNTSYQVVIMSDNKNDVIVLYHLFKALLIATYEHLELSGLDNIRMSGGDVSYSPGVPDRTFIRHIALNFDYETVSVEFNLNTVIDKINVIIKLTNE